MAYSKAEIKKAFDKIISHIEEGNSLRAALRLDDMPSSHVFYEWIDDDEEKKKQYACACEDRADAIFEDMFEIADDGTNDTYINDKGETYTDQDVIQRSKLRIDTRKWALSKMNPKKYGDKTEIDAKISGEVIKVVIQKMDK